MDGAEYGGHKRICYFAVITDVSVAMLLGPSIHSKIKMGSKGG